jgi:hypothetical protein
MSCPLQATSCWNDAVAEAQTCLPSGDGVLSSDRKTCRFSDGTVATFDEPAATTSGALNPSVTIAKEGTTCARLARPTPEANVTLTTTSGVHDLKTNLSGVTLTCGGETHSYKWSQCETEDNSFDVTGQPGLTYSAGADSVFIGFQGYFPVSSGGTGFSSFESWFTCTLP